MSPSVYRYPRRGLYDGETVTFTRDSKGRATEVKVGGVVFPRRAVGPSDMQDFSHQATDADSAVLARGSVGDATP